MLFFISSFAICALVNARCAGERERNKIKMSMQENGIGSISHQWARQIQMKFVAARPAADECKLDNKFSAKSTKWLLSVCFTRNDHSTEIWTHFLWSLFSNFFFLRAGQNGFVRQFVENLVLHVICSWAIVGQLSQNVMAEPISVVGCWLLLRLKSHSKLPIIWVMHMHLSWKYCTNRTTHARILKTNW